MAPVNAYRSGLLDRLAVAAGGSARGQFAGRSVPFEPTPDQWERLAVEVMQAIDGLVLPDVSAQTPPAEIEALIEKVMSTGAMYAEALAQLASPTAKS